MGFRIQLISITGKVPGTIQQEYGVAPTGEHEEIAESPVVGAMLPSGAYLLYVNDQDRINPDPKAYARLSAGASLVACYANETVMHSYACGWSNGVERWTISHDAQHGIEHLETTGDMPSELAPIRERLFAQQAGDDGADFIFDIPVELFVALGGVRYDQDIPGAAPNPWEILNTPKRTSSGTGFWSCLPFRK